jgi:surface polysaccharide O-acyltransferase-like enzyme
MKKSESVKTRQSNFELLRIIAMFMILLSHFIGAGLQTSQEISKVGRELNIFSLNYLGIHVNLFLLITGYFGINFSWKNFSSLFVKCLFYSLVIYLIAVFIGFKTFTLSDLLRRFLFFCRRDPWWFIESYFYLFFLSPLLNICIANMNRITYTKVLALLLFFNCIIGGLFRGSINVTGFTVSQFILIYFIGGYIKRHVDFNKYPRKLVRKYSLFTFFAAMTISYIINHLIIELWRGYVNPFNIIGAVSIFILFSTFDFKSKVVNYVAGSALAVYLIQDESTIMRGFFQNLLLKVGDKYPVFLLYVPITVFFAIFIFMICILIDKIFGFLILNRVAKFVYKFDPIVHTSGKINKLFKENE